MISTEPLIADPLRQRVELPIKATLYPLGFPLELSTNSTDVVACARRAWEYFPPRFQVEPVSVRILVAEGAEPLPLPAYRAQGELFSIVASRENFASCNLGEGFGFGCFTSSAAADHARLSMYFLEAMVYACLTRLHLTAVHASCVEIEGQGILLCGESGAGKSCLAYACARSGFAFVSDDSTALVRHGVGRQVIGKPGHIRLRESAVEILPELRGTPPQLSPSGKDTLEIVSSEVPGLHTKFECRADFLVFLNRSGTGAAKFLPVPREDARRRLEEQLPVLESTSYAEQIASVERLLDCERLELQYRELAKAVALLEELTSRGR